MADPISAATILSAAAPAAAVAAPATATLGLGALGAGAGALGTMGAVAANPLVGAMAGGALGGSLLGMAGDAALGQAATIIPTQAFPAALSSANPAFVGPQTFMGPQAPTFMQSAINTGQNIQGLMSENPALTSVAKQAASGMMQPQQKQVLQAPPIQSGQFAPVDFMSLLNPRQQQIPRRTSLLG